MTKGIHRVIAYGIIAVGIVIAIFIYGLTIGGEISPVSMLVEFVVLFFILAVIRKNDIDNKPIYRFVIILLLSAAVTVLTVFVYHTVNDAYGNSILEFDTVILDVSYGRGGTGNLSITDPEGNVVETPTNDHRSWLFVSSYDESRFVKGDKIRVREYSGLFHLPFYRIIEAEEGKYFK